ncbi:MAG: hypothetical protein IJQ81_18310, partial [Oscillibacter sp.]|nr:hypothetical protein [Oscillibacter sp.]
PLQTTLTIPEREEGQGEGFDSAQLAEKRFTHIRFGPRLTRNLFVCYNERRIYAATHYDAPK